VNTCSLPIICKKVYNFILFSEAGLQHKDECYRHSTTHGHFLPVSGAACGHRTPERPLRGVVNARATALCSKHMALRGGVHTTHYVDTSTQQTAHIFRGHIVRCVDCITLYAMCTCGDTV
jgi:hypothetical protein